MSQATLREKVMIMVVACSSLFINISLLGMPIPILPAILVKEPSVSLNVTTNGSESIVVHKYSDLSNNTQGNGSDTGLGDGVKLAILFGVAGVVTIICIPLVGFVVDRTNPFLSLIIGNACNLTSCLFYAFGKDYWTLLVARIFNGCGSACISCGSYACIYNTFLNEKIRGRMAGILNLFVWAGASLGPAFGGFAYSFMGQEAAFLTLVPIVGFTITLIVILYMKCTCPPKKTVLKNDNESEHMDATNHCNGINQSNVKEKVKPTPIQVLLIDPHCMLTVLLLGLTEFEVYCLDPTLALWMRQKFSSDEFQQGIIWISGIAFSILGTLAAGFICHKCFSHRYIFVICGFFILGCTCLVTPFVGSWYFLFFTIGMMYFGVSLLEYLLVPFLSTLVDERHTPVYGSITSIMMGSINAFQAIGAVLAGVIVERFGFLQLNVGLFCMYALCSPLILFSRRYFKDRTQCLEVDSIGEPTATLDAM